MMPADSQRRDSTPSNQESVIDSPSGGTYSDILCSLSILILSERLLCEEKQQLSRIKKVIYDIITRGHRTLCIDVKGHQLPLATKNNEMSLSSSDSHDDLSKYHRNGTHDDEGMILIEKWTLSLIPFNSDGSINTTNVQFLSQAMKSFLYFSQINSWSVSNGGRCPFGLFHRVYTNDSTSTDQSSSSVDYPLPEYHRFPLVRLNCSSPDCVEVRVTFIPRLDTIPSQLVSPEEHQLSMDLHNKLYIEVTDDSATTCPKTDTSSTIAHSVHTGDDNKPEYVKNGFDRGSNGSRLVFPLAHKLVPKPSPSSICQKLDTDNNVTTKHTKSSRLIISNLHSRPSPTSSSNTSVVSHPIHRDNDTSKGVQPPAASSPIPFLLRRASLTNKDSKEKENRKKLKRRSCGVYSIKNSSSPTTPPTRSMSLPAVVPNLCLLGTFEESVLNGRIDPLGYVDGFTAELGASGSFCPPHVSLPVSAAFFSLSDDRGSSPYLGHVDLSVLRKKGYHIPRKGTIQLTLFNPNKTVVKVFIIFYDHSDMPSKTTTFIRQKTLSRSLHNEDSQTGLTLPCLQYLIHLRFLCSKSGHVYLHTDIKMLFARRAPDTDPDIGQVSLFTTHEGPVNPKYGPLSIE